MGNRNYNEETPGPWDDDSEFPYDVRIVLDALRLVYEDDPLERKLGRQAAKVRHKHMRYLRRLDSYVMGQTPPESEYMDHAVSGMPDVEGTVCSPDGARLGYYELNDPYGDDAGTPGLN